MKICAYGNCPVECECHDEATRKLDTMTRAVQKDDQHIEDLKAALKEEMEVSKARALMVANLEAEVVRLSEQASAKNDLRKALRDADLQVRDQSEHIKALEESLKDVLDISEIEGAVNVTVEETCKLVAARSLLLPGHRWTKKCDFKDCGKDMPCPDHWTKEQAEALIQEVGFLEKRSCSGGTCKLKEGHDGDHIVNLRRRCICPNGTRTAIAHVNGCPAGGG